MKRLFSLSVGAVVLFAMIATANATVIIDSTTGWDGYFAWNDGLGQIDAITETANSYAWGIDIDWSITVGADSTMSLVTAWDAGAPGDEFALYVDGVETSWSTTYADGGYFHGLFDDLFLSAGTHLLTFYTTALAPNYLFGSAHASFSGVVPAAPVPEPSTMLLLGAGLAGLTVYRRKARK